MKLSLQASLWAFVLLNLSACSSTPEASGQIVVVEDAAMADTSPMADLGAIGADTDATPGLDATPPNEADAEPTQGPDEDSDGDGYTNAQEEHAGTDPMNHESVIYRGGWPYNMHKDDLAAGEWNVPPADSLRIPRYQAIDQYGDTFDLYDLAGQGRKIVLDVGTWFCEPCKAMAQYFTDGDPSVMDDFGWWNEGYNIVREMIESEEIYWVTVLYSGGVAVTQEDVTRWHDAFPNHHILVLGDVDLQLKEYLGVRAMPHIAVLDEHMNFLVYSVRGPTPGMRYLVDAE